MTTSFMILFIILIIFKILVMRIILIQRIYISITLLCLNYPWFISLVSFIIFTIFKTTTASCFYDPEILPDVEEKVRAMRHVSEEMKYDTYFDYKGRKLVYYGRYALIYYPDGVIRIYYPEGTNEICTNVEVEKLFSGIDPRDSDLSSSESSDSSDSSEESFRFKQPNITHTNESTRHSNEPVVQSDELIEGKKPKENLKPPLPEDFMILQKKIQILGITKTVLTVTTTKDVMIMSLLSQVNSVTSETDINSLEYLQLLEKIKAMCSTEAETNLLRHYTAALATYKECMKTTVFATSNCISIFENFLYQEQKENMIYKFRQGYVKQINN